MARKIVFLLGQSYGSLPGVVSRYYVYGSAIPGAVDIYRGDDRTKDPIGRGYYTPNGYWWFQWYVTREGLTEWNAEFRERFTAHMAGYVKQAIADGWLVGSPN